jgi:hypothetical protein
MFYARDLLDGAPDALMDALPRTATRCLLSCSCSDHARAEQLRVRSASQQANSQRRTRRLRVDSKLTEVRARELAQEVR